MESLIGLSIIEKLLAIGDDNEDILSSICEKYLINQEDLIKLRNRMNVVHSVNEKFQWIVEEKLVLLPELYKTEYSRLKKLVTDNQLYGAFLQVKDVYEISLKFPTLIILSYWMETEKDHLPKAQLNILHKLNNRLTLQQWLSIAKDTYKVLIKINKKPHQNTHINVLESVLKNTIDLYQTTDFIDWRNHYIGHGALGTFENHDYKKKFFDKITSYYDYLSNSETFNALSSIEILKVGATYTATIHNVMFPLHPLCKSIEGFNLYDSFDLKNNLFWYLDYQKGIKHPIVERELLKFYRDLQEKNSIKAQSNRSLDQMNTLEELHFIWNVNERSNYTHPTYLMDQVKQWTTDFDRGIFHICMEEGMGKTMFTRALNEFDLNKYNLPNTTIRVFHIHAQDRNQLQSFTAEIGIELCRYRKGGQIVRAKKTYSFPLNSQPSPQYLLNTLTKYQQLYYRETSRKKLLLIIDGLDEINSQEPNILDYLPKNKSMPENLYILCTSRYLKNQQEWPSDYFEEELTIRQNNPENIAVLKEFLTNQINIEGNAVDVLSQLPDKRFLLLKPYNDLKRLRPKLFIDPLRLADQYYEVLNDEYGPKYINRISQLLAIFTITPFPLSLTELSYMLDLSEPDQALLAKIYDINGWIRSEVLYHEQVFEMALDKWKEDFSRIDDIKNAKDLLYNYWENYLQMDSLNKKNELLITLWSLYLEERSTLSETLRTALHSCIELEMKQANSRRRIQRLLHLVKKAASIESYPRNFEYYLKILQWESILTQNANSLQTLANIREIINKHKDHKQHSYHELLYLQYEVKALQELTIAPVRRSLYLEENVKNFSKWRKKHLHTSHHSPAKYLRKTEKRMINGKLTLVMYTLTIDELQTHLEEYPEEWLIVLQYISLLVGEQNHFGKFSEAKQYIDLFEALVNKLKLSSFIAESEILSIKIMKAQIDINEMNNTINKRRDDHNQKVNNILKKLNQDTELDIMLKAFENYSVIIFPMYQEKPTLFGAGNTDLKIREAFFQIFNELWEEYKRSYKLLKHGINTSYLLYIMRLHLFLIDEYNFSIVQRVHLYNFARDFLRLFENYQSPIYKKDLLELKATVNKYSSFIASKATILLNEIVTDFSRYPEIIFENIDDVIVYLNNSSSTPISNELLYKCFLYKQYQFELFIDAPDLKWLEHVHHLAYNPTAFENEPFKKAILYYVEGMWTFYLNNANEPSGEYRVQTARIVNELLTNAFNYFKRTYKQQPFTREEAELFRIFYNNVFLFIRKTVSDMKSFWTDSGLFHLLNEGSFYSLKEEVQKQYPYLEFFNPQKSNRVITHSIRKREKERYPLLLHDAF